MAQASELSTFKVDDETTAIVIVGEIVEGDARKFTNLAGKYDDAIVMLESPGGSLSEAIQIGEAIRLKGYATAVINESECNSACGLIWLAGAPRALSKSGRVGFHAAYSNERGTARESGVANAIVGRYLTLLNLPEKAVIFATSASPNELGWVTSANYRQLGIDVEIISDIEFEKPSPGPARDTEYARSRNESDVWKHVGIWTIAVDHTIDDGCFAMSSFDNDSVFRIGIDPVRSKSYYLFLGNSNWASLKEGEEYQLSFQFDQESPWDAPARAVELGDALFLLVTFSDEAFWSEFITAQVLSVSRGNTSVTKLRLDGSKVAFDELIACQTAQNNRKQARDPFAK